MQIIYKNQQYSIAQWLALPKEAAWQEEIDYVLRFCLGDQGEFGVQTSGSTGTPKTMTLSRTMMWASAQTTLTHFGLKGGSSAVLALPASKIGGIMMVVRAFLGELNLHVQPPKQKINLTVMDAFVPLTPSQFIVSNKSSKYWRSATVLLGGGPAPAMYEWHAKQVFVGYGMTETASHVALRELQSEVYHAVGSTTFSTRKDALVIDAPHLGIEGLTTTDVVELLTPTSFNYLGRLDFAINSGGVKLHPEELEATIAPFVERAYYVSSMEEETYGEYPVLVVLEHEGTWTPVALPDASRTWALPRRVVAIQDWPLTSGGKLDRTALRATIKSQKHLPFLL